MLGWEGCWGKALEAARGPGLGGLSDFEGWELGRSLAFFGKPLALVLWEVWKAERAGVRPLGGARKALQELLKPQKEP